MDLKQIEVRLPARENECGQIFWCLNAFPSSFDPQLKITVFGEVWVNNVIILALKTMQSRRGSSSYTSFNS